MGASLRPLLCQIAEGADRKPIFGWSGRSADGRDALRLSRSYRRPSAGLAGFVAWPVATRADRDLLLPKTGEVVLAGAERPARRAFDAASLLARTRLELERAADAARGRACAAGTDGVDAGAGVGRRLDAAKAGMSRSPP